MSVPPSLAAWAAADPAARDALLAAAERAVALQPAAEAAIQHGRPGAAAPPGWAEDANRVLEAYRSLRAPLRSLDPAPVAGELADLLDRHAELVDGALHGRTVEGLGPMAGRLVGLRDLLRRMLAVAGRAVSDVPGV